jgi:hypothetical protein
MNALLSSRRLAQGLVALAAAGTILTTTGVAASAAPTYDNATAVQVGWTDSATPKAVYPADIHTDLPLGTTTGADGVTHTTRVYATFDVTAFRGTHVTAAHVFVTEDRVADCGKRVIELWQTDVMNKAPAWNAAPAERRLLDTVNWTSWCPAGSLSFDATAAVVDAVARGDKSVALELRVPAVLEADPSYARQLYGYRGVQMSVEHNVAPEIVAKDLYNSGYACQETEPGRPVSGLGDVGLQAVVTDADPMESPNLSVDFAYWPADDPSNRSVVTVRGLLGHATNASLPAASMVDGATYGWQVRATDGEDFSPWSKTCYITVDRTRPPAPAVSSPNFPNSSTPGPVGEPVTFVFSAGGNTDVAGFTWSWDAQNTPGCPYGDLGLIICPPVLSGDTAKKLDTPGGSVRVRLNAPSDGHHRLYVNAVDAAGNWSSGGTPYEVWVPETDPQITVVAGTVRWNQRVTLSFAPAAGVTSVTSYSYRIGAAPTQTVAAGADGTARVDVLLDNEYGVSVLVRSNSSNGFVSSEGHWSAEFDPWPDVTAAIYTQWEFGAGGVGVPDTFTFSPPPGQFWSDNLRGYQYSFNFADPQFIAAGPGGTASLTWAPDTPGGNILEVWAVAADGTLSEYENFYSFDVAA